MTPDEPSCNEDQQDYCSYLIDRPVPVHKSFEFIFMNCPFFQVLKDVELIRFNESQIAKREKDFGEPTVFGCVSRVRAWWPTRAGEEPAFRQEVLR
jgi:hypothetical protein